MWDIYGSTFTVYNVHNLLHLHEDVSFFNCSLNDVSAFQFKNHLQVIKEHDVLDSDHDTPHLTDQDNSDHEGTDAGDSDRKVWTWDMIDSYLCKIRR